MAMPPIATPCQRGKPATTSSTAAPAISCPARMASVPMAVSDRDPRADRRAVTFFEKVADRQVAARRGERPQFRADPEREHQRAESSRAVPPPGADAVPIRDARRANGGAGADVGGEHGAADQRPRQLAAGDKEIRWPAHFASNPDAKAVMPTVYTSSRTRATFTPDSLSRLCPSDFWRATAASRASLLRRPVRRSFSEGGSLGEGAWRRSLDEGGSMNLVAPLIPREYQQACLLRMPCCCRSTAPTQALATRGNTAAQAVRLHRARTSPVRFLDRRMGRGAQSAGAQGARCTGAHAVRKCAGAPGARKPASNMIEKAHSGCVID